MDPNGFVFFYEGGVYRAIRQRRASFVGELIRSGDYGTMVKKLGLVEACITGYSIPEADCPLVLKHPVIEPANYCVEWSPQMHRDAAIQTLEIAIDLADRGLMLQDAYPWNQFFVGSKPIFIDLTSIVPASERMLWPAYQQFLNFYYYPLVLMAQGKGDVVRKLLFNHIDGILPEQYAKLVGLGHWLKNPSEWAGYGILKLADAYMNRSGAAKKNLLDRIETIPIQPIGPTLRKRFLSNLLKKIRRISFKANDSRWKRYYEDRRELELLPDRDHAANWTEKQKRVFEVLEKEKPAKLIDLGCNTGWYSFLAANQGIRVTAVDTDEVCVDQLYFKSKAQGLTIMPLIFNAVAPTPPYGALSQQFPSGLERFKSDLVLALAVIHHMHISGRQSFNQIARTLHELAPKAVVEYIDLEDEKVRFMRAGRVIDYNLESVCDALRNYYPAIEVFPSDCSTRKLLLCS